MIRLASALIALCVFSGPSFAQSLAQTPDVQAAPVKIVVGVRKNAKPFSHFNSVLSENNRATKSGPLRAQGYEGYMVYICDEIFKEMSIAQDGSPRFDVAQVEVVEIKPKEGRFERLGADVDILCDPATITRDRVKRFAVSPPLFATGISFLTLKDIVQPDPEDLGRENVPTFIGVVGHTTALDIGIDKIIDSGEWNRHKKKVTTALRATGDSEDARQTRHGVIKAFDTHADLARAFCDKDVVHYIGDLEMISYYANGYSGCDWQRAPRSYTSDRYGIFAHIDYTGKPDKAILIGRFFEVLNREIATRDSLLDRAYRATFREQEKTRALELFYWSVRGVP